jgi:hypothetical protein
MMPADCWNHVPPQFIFCLKKKILFFSSFSISLVNLAGFFAEKKRDDDSVDSILMKSDNLLSGALHSIVIQKRRGECTYIESEPTK